jgi:hypothetical protein
MPTAATTTAAATTGRNAEPLTGCSTVSACLLVTLLCEPGDTVYFGTKIQTATDTAS